MGRPASGHSTPEKTNICKDKTTSEFAHKMNIKKHYSILFPHKDALA
jgi:hypothetical protein